MIRANQIKLVPLSDIRLNPKNRNKHPPEQIDRLIEIIKYQGFRRPVTISNRSGYLSCGEGRYLAAKKMGLEKIPSMFQDYETEEQEYADGIADNTIDKWAELDMSSIYNDIPQFENLNIDMLGFKEFQLPEKFKPQCNEDEVPEQVEPKTKLGDLYQLGEHRLLCGDSTDVLQVEKLMNGQKAVLLLTDPPYGVEYDANWRNDAAKKGMIRYGTSKNLGKVQNDGNADWSAVYATFDCKVAYVWHAGKFSSLIQKNLEDCGYQIVSQIIWAKPSFAISRGDYHWQHEPCWYAVKKGENHNWQGARDQSTLWKINRDKEVNGHSTPKPIALLEISIGNNTKGGEAVADPFGGSGSTLIACEKTKRKCFMMELDPHYCDVIVARWEKYTGKKAELV